MAMDGTVSGRIAEFLVNGTGASTHVSELLLTTNGRMSGKGRRRCAAHEPVAAQ